MLVFRDKPEKKESLLFVPMDFLKMMILNRSICNNN